MKPKPTSIPAWPVKREPLQVMPPGIEDLVTDDDRLTMPTEDTSFEFLSPRREVGVSPPSAEALEPDWEHLGG